MKFIDRVKAGTVIFDGGFGTMIQPYMLPGELPELLNLRLKKRVEAVHAAYLDAGCDVVETNTLNANRRKIENSGHSVEEVIGAAVDCARRAVKSCGREAYVALSMGSTGVMLEPLGDMSFDEACDIYAQMAAAGQQAGADLILIETVSDLHEIKAAIIGARRATQLPVAVTMAFMENGRLLTGADVRTAVIALEGMGADIIGMNCGLGPKQMLTLADDMLSCAHVPVLINPNAGMPRLENGKSVYSVSPEEFARDAALLVKKGAALIGGCCGTTPAHIAALKAEIERNPAGAAHPVAADQCAITSGARSVEFTGEDVLICDITSPDMEDMLDNAMDSQAGAVKLACDDLDKAAKYIQETMLKPMYLCGDAPEAVARAARPYNGKPLIGIARAENIDQFIETARACGAALAVGEKALVDKAVNALGMQNVVIDCKDVLLKPGGEIAARVIKE